LVGHTESNAARRNQRFSLGSWYSPFQKVDIKRPGASRTQRPRPFFGGREETHTEKNKILIFRVLGERVAFLLIIAVVG